MKKITALIITAIMLFSLCACEKKGDAYSSATATDITDRQIQELIEQAENAQSGTNG